MARSRYLDEQIGRLVDELKRRGLYDKTLIVLTADHGEEFHEHGGWWHGTTLYDEQIGVPLIVKPGQGGARGRVVDELAMSIDIAPTVLAAAGVAKPPAMQGHALPLGDAAAPTRDSVFAEEDLRGQRPAGGADALTSKLITANPGNPRGLQPEELYDVAKDPGEQKSLVASEPTWCSRRCAPRSADRTSRRVPTRAPGRRPTSTASRRIGCRRWATWTDVDPWVRVYWCSGSTARRSISSRRGSPPVSCPSSGG